MKLEEGKRYVRRDGLITAPLIFRDDGRRYPYWDDAHDNSYKESGYYRTPHYEDDPEDLIKELSEAPNTNNPS